MHTFLVSILTKHWSNCYLGKMVRWSLSFPPLFSYPNSCLNIQCHISYILTMSLSSHLPIHSYIYVYIQLIFATCLFVLFSQTNYFVPSPAQEVMTTAACPLNTRQILLCFDVKGSHNLTPFQLFIVISLCSTNVILYFGQTSSKVLHLTIFILLQLFWDVVHSVHCKRKFDWGQLGDEV